MKTYPALMLTGLITMILIGLFASTSPATVPEINATVDINPDVLNLKRANTTSGVITAYVSNLTKDETSYDVDDINTSTIKLYYMEQFITEATRATVKKDVLTAKFDATQVANYIWTNIAYHMGSIPPRENYRLTLTVRGQLLNSAETFAGDDTIKIIFP